MKARFLTTALALAAVSLAAAQRMPTVTYSVSGSSGNWALDFTLTSNFLPGEGQFYFFGVELLTGRDILGSPTSWDPNQWTTWDNTGYGGSSIVYNNVWIEQVGNNYVNPGMSLSGFTARSTDNTAPAEVRWFAYAYNGTYNGNDFINHPSNPGFEGVATAVPEPATLAGVTIGIAALLRRRR